MTRSYKTPKQYVKHSYHSNTPSPLSPKSVKKSGAGKHSWGSDRDFLSAALEEAHHLEREEKKKMMMEEKERRKSEEWEDMEREGYTMDGGGDGEGILEDGAKGKEVEKAPMVPPGSTSPSSSNISI